MTRVRCIDAKEEGIPLKEGEIYTVKRAFSEVPEWGGESIPGFILHEVGGRYRQDRFEPVEEGSK